MAKQAIVFHKRLYLILLVGLLILIFFIFIWNRQKLPRSSTLSFPVETQHLSRIEIEDRVNEYFIPALTMFLGEKGCEFIWEYDANAIYVSIVADAKTIRTLKKVIGLEWPAYLRSKEILHRQQSAEAMQQLFLILTKYQKDNDGKFPDRINQLNEYDVNDLLPWVLDNVEYHGDQKALYDFRIPVAFDKKLFQRGKGTIVLFGDGHVVFKKPDKLSKLGILQ